MQVSSKGQSLIELVVVIALITLVVGALTFGMIISLRNADLANSQIQATKLAQEGLEKVKAIKNQDIEGVVNYRVDADRTLRKFSQLWDISFSCGDPPNCYFKLDSSGRLNGVNIVTDTEVVPGGIFKRQISIEGPSDNTFTITSIIKWSDFSGEHESRLKTFLGKK